MDRQRSGEGGQLAVLLVVFNRPETLGPVLHGLRSSRPQRVYVARDAPRGAFPADTQRCALVRALVESIDWTDEVRWLSQPANLGFSKATESAIEWFFEHEPRGIVLEDDCVTSPAFYRFASQLLERYDAEPRVRFVAGHNPLGRVDLAASYFFSTTPYIWGWASWRHKWFPFDSSIPAWDDIAVRRQVRSRMDSRYYRLMRRYWRRIRRGSVTSWDLALHFDLLASGQVSIIPARNLVTNIGFGDGSTNSPVAWPMEYRQQRDDNFEITSHPSDCAASPVLERALRDNRFPLSRRIGELLPARGKRIVRRVVARKPGFGYMDMRERLLKRDGG